MSDAKLLIKKYGNRRLYDTEASQYVTLEEVARRVREGRDVKVVDAKTHADLTKSVLLQVITEMDREHDLLPLSFLQQMIRLGDDSRHALHRYLTVTVSAFVEAQQQLESQYRTFADRLFNPMAWVAPWTSAPPVDAPRESADSTGTARPVDDESEGLESMRRQIARMQQMLRALSKNEPD